MRVDTFACDVCGVQKKETNHWWMIRQSNKGLVILPWETDKAHDAPWGHFCGEACVQKKVSEFLSGAKQ